ncbi:MAG: diguanylate cyclase [Gaiellaceae bacterium]
MISFKLRLVVYFVLLSLLPLVAAFGGFSAVAKRGEARLADARLQAALRAGIAAYDQELAAAERTAAQLARNPGFQRALASGDRVRLRRILSELPHLRLESRDGLRIGHTPALAAERQVVVIGPPTGELGVVIASVPLNSALATRIRSRAGLDPEEHVVFLNGGRIVAASGGLTGALEVPTGRTATPAVGGVRYRALSAAAPSGRRGATLAVLTPQARIDAANRSTEGRLLFALAVSLLLVLSVAYLEGRAIVGTVRKLVDATGAIASGRLHERVPVRGRDELALLGRAFNEMAEQLEDRLDELGLERRRLREATLRFGEALAATHDVDQLLRAVVEAAVESTGATGGFLLGRKGELVQAGDPDAGSQRIELPLHVGQHNFGTLVLTGSEFTIQDLETASLLVGHAVVALDNARLHAIVERQALVDGLTGLANRRHGEDALDSELSRARRFGSPLSIVLADLDDFKRVNDRYGHPAGDVVLGEFAQVLLESVREIDLAARWGGEEFVVMLPGTESAGAVQVAERIRATFAERTILTPEGVPLRVTASFGVASVPPSGTQEELLSAADGALYEAKAAGKNTVVANGEPAPRL